MYGREARVPIDVTLQASSLNKNRRLIQKPRLSGCWRCRRIYMKMHLQTSRKHSLTRSSSMMQNVTHILSWKIGDKNDGRKGGKVEINFKGSPYTIAEDIGKGLFHLKDAKGKLLKTVTNCHWLKIWHDPQTAKPNQLLVNINSLVCLLI